MARTTDPKVRSITDVGEDADLGPFILMANELVTEICVPSGYTNTRLELIERALAAHFYHVMDPETVFEGAGTVQQSLPFKVDKGFDETRWGQQAMTLDTKGGLAALNNRLKIIRSSKVSVKWLGTDPKA